MNIAVEIAFIVSAYLAGSVPTGYLLTRYATGLDIMKLGSGNIGSTNVGRIAGRKIAAVVQLSDMVKGLLPVGLYLYMAYSRNMLPGLPVYYIALAAILGHDFSIFLKFRGGKGVNTTLGASVLLAPLPVFISVVLYFIVKWRFKFVSLGSIVLGIALPLCELLINGATPAFYYLLVCMALIIVLHRKNIGRLLRDRELPY